MSIGSSVFAVRARDVHGKALCICAFLFRFLLLLGMRFDAVVVGMSVGVSMCVVTVLGRRRCGGELGGACAGKARAACAVAGAGGFHHFKCMHRHAHTDVLAQFERLHKNGSSHGGSRITRRLYVQRHFAEMMTEVCWMADVLTGADCHVRRHIRCGRASARRLVRSSSSACTCQSLACTVSRVAWQADRRTERWTSGCQDAGDHCARASCGCAHRDHRPHADIRALRWVACDVW